MATIFGMHPVIEAVRSGKKIDKVLLKQGLDGPLYRELITLLGENDIAYQYVPIEKLNRTVRGAHQGVVAILAEIDCVSLEVLVNNALATSKEPLVVILDEVSDVRNLGAIARSLECAGGSGIIVPSKGGAAINAEAVKSSAGALMRIDTARVDNLKVAAYYLKQSGFHIVAASEKATQTIYEASFAGPVAIIAGNEGKGISKALLAIADETASIPQKGDIGSLNVSVATSIVLFEAVRQRSGK